MTDILATLETRFCVKYFNNNCSGCPFYDACCLCHCVPADAWSKPEEEIEQLFRQQMTHTLAAYDAQH